MEQMTMTSYAGFWKRFLAYVIDALIIGAVYLVILVPVFGLLGLGAASAENFENEEAATGFFIAAMGVYFFAVLAIFIAGWLYFALMESSARQATLGKMALGIVVTDINGNRVSFGRATGRFFGKIVSGMILYIGYIMAGFTEKKQALHDIMAGCLVVNK